MVVAIISQGLSTAVSILMSLIVPKMLGVTEYGYWQLFIFYFSYIGFFHFGLNDGVYLTHGGLARDELDKRNINSQFVFGLVLEIIFAAGIIAVAFVGPFESARQFVIVAVALAMIVYNASCYLGYVFQAVNETALFSYSAVWETVIFAVALVVLLLLRVTQFEPYVVAYAASRCGRLAYCCIKGRDILGAGLLPMREAVAESCKSIRVGINLMVANIASGLILGIVRFFVDANWGIEVFSVVSLSLSLATFFLTFLSQVSMVLFPNLKRLDEKRCSSVFVIMRDALDLLLPCIYVLYTPIVLILMIWLPEYAKGIALFSTLFPICAFEAKMDLAGTTFFKILRKEKELLALNAAAVVASLACTLVGAYVLQSVQIILVCAVVILGLRSYIADVWVTRTLSADSNILGVASILVSVIFVVVAQFTDYALTSIAFIPVYLVYLIVFRKRLAAVAHSLSSLKGVAN